MLKEMRINEVAYVEGLLSSATLDMDNITPNMAICYFTRYYYGLGLSFDETKQIIIDKMNSYNLDVRDYQEYKAASRIKKYYDALVNGKMNVLRNTDTIVLYKSEYDKIMSCANDKEKKVLFTLYILARFTNKYGWVYQSRSDIGKLANVSPTVMSDENILNTLLGQHQIKITKKVDDTKVGVELSDGVDDEVVLEISKIDKLGNQWIAFAKEGYIVCANCGKLVKKKSKMDYSTKYCDKCAAEIHKEQDRKYQTNKYKELRS